MSDQDQRAACDLDAVPRFACALICPGGEREAKRHLAKNMLLQMADELRRLRAEHDELVAARLKISQLQTHPCYDIESGEFDHDWKHVDDSFSHEFGTEVCGHMECQHCNAEDSDREYVRNLMCSQDE